MNIFIHQSYEQASEAAYRHLLEKLVRLEKPVLGLPTGSTPLGLYRCMAEGYRNGDYDYSRVTSFNLDEYRGMDGTEDESYMMFMKQKLFSHINIPADSINIPSGTGDADDVCSDYDGRISLAGGIDIQILGVGSNGHIGFNEPGTPFESTTHLTALSEETRSANARFFSSPEMVPTHAVTMGIRLIMNARVIIFIASGSEKADAVYEAVNGPVSVDCPASVLKLHPDITMFLDSEAAARLEVQVI